MRSTRELIRELRREAERLTHVAVAVAFDQETKFVLAAAADPLSELNGLVQAGGVPLGILGVLEGGGEARFYARPLHEHAQAAWVADYLRRLVPSFTEGLVAAGDLPREIVPA